jgi:preprotein translocase subunit SecB
LRNTYQRRRTIAQDPKKTATPEASEDGEIQVRVVGQFIKDLSFENPNVGKMLEGPGDNPNLKIEVNVNANQMGPDLYGSDIEFSAVASSKAGKIYELELVYGGLFKIESMPASALEPFLLINCPALIFPFARRLIADITREGGFPPLLLDPIDFSQLYMSKRQQVASNGNDKKPN